jgi:hypothetical protein
MARPQNEPLRSLTQEERSVLEQVANATSERADSVARSKALLAVADGAPFTEAAGPAGRRQRAHALELPGKLRLDRDAYLAVQTIHYPGFTIVGGIGEAGGLIVTLVPLFLHTVGKRSLLADTGGGFRPRRHAGCLLDRHSPGEQILAARRNAKGVRFCLLLIRSCEQAPAPDRGRSRGLDGPARPRGVLARRARWFRPRQPDRARHRAQVVIEAAPILWQSRDLQSHGRQQDGNDRHGRRRINGSIYPKPAGSSASTRWLQALPRLRHVSLTRAFTKENAV